MDKLTRVCPNCLSELLPGPRGGAARNFYCSNRTTCRAGFNLTVWEGEVIWQEPIGEVDDSTFAMYAIEPKGPR